MAEASSRPVVSICAPAFNEEEGIAQVVRYWADVVRRDGIAGQIVVANDGSTDRTLEILQAVQNEIPFLKIVDYKPNRGYGYALAQAIGGADGDYIVTIDSDGQFDAAEYRLLLDELRHGRYDLVTGYRMGKRDTFIRVIADRGLNLLVRAMFGLRLRDTNCALKLLTRDVAQAVQIEARGYPTPTEILVKAQTLGYRIGEVGITHSERLAGQSKLKTFRTSWQMGWFLVYLKLKQMLYRARVVNRM
jgi:glycosyltransferase involved in cell wall biosynthesis